MWLFWLFRVKFSHCITPSQGESNAIINMNKYNCSFPAMIDDWRSSFHEASGGQTALDFPFGFVQVSHHYNHRPTVKNKNKKTSYWPLISHLSWSTTLMFSVSYSFAWLDWGWPSWHPVAPDSWYWLCPKPKDELNLHGCGDGSARWHVTLP